MSVKNPPQELQRRDIALSDLQYWCKWPVGLTLWNCHRKWCDAVQAVVESSVYKGLLILAPADHGKTSSVMLPAVSWLHGRNQASRIAYVMNKDNYAEQVGRAWARLIERKNGMMDKEFGLRKGDKWSDSEYCLELPEREWEGKDSSLMLLGIGSEIQSQRFDFIFCDDMATRKNSAAVAGRDKISSYFFTDLRSRLDKGGKFIVASHRVHPEDIYQSLLGKEDWLVVVDRAIINDETQEILCPENFTYKQLAEMRDDDPTGFALFYQQLPISQGLYVMREQVTRCFDRDKKFLLNIPDDIRSRYAKIVMTLDPAFSTSKWAKYAVLEVWGLVDEGDRMAKRELLYGYRAKLEPESLIAMAKAKFNIYLPDLFVIESNTGQALLKPVLQKAFPTYESRIVDTPTVNPRMRGESQGRLDEEMGEMLKYFHRDICPIVLPYGDRTSQEFCDAFVEEIINYPNYKFSDCLMAWYLLEKSLGLLPNDARRGEIHAQGVLGGVSDAVWSRFRRPLRRS